MAEKTKNLCAQIPESLHAKVRERQEASGQTLGQYMTELITKFYEQEGKPTMKENQRTVAFQVSTELFDQFKTTSSGRASSRTPSSWPASSGRWRRNRRRAAPRANKRRTHLPMI